MGYNERLTGRSRVRQGTVGGWFNRRPVLILQLEYASDESHSDSGGNQNDWEHYTAYDWRDATVEHYICYATGSNHLDRNPEPRSETGRVVKMPPRLPEQPPQKVPNGFNPTAGPKPGAKLP